VAYDNILQIKRLGNGLFSYVMSQYIAPGSPLTNALITTTTTTDIPTNTYTGNPKDAGKPICAQAQGNPINAGTGNKVQEEVDYTGTGPFPLQLTRTYNSQITNGIGSGVGWRSHYGTRVLTPNATTVWLSRPDGKQYTYTLTGGIWTADADVTDKLVQRVDAKGQTAGWTYTQPDATVENYDAGGMLTSITHRTGLTQTLTYSTASTAAAVAPIAGLLLTVTDSFGRTLNFTYDASNRVSTMTDPAGGVYTYAYDTNSNLISVTYPDGKMRQYVYENTSFPHLLTGIVDEDGNRYATWTYDASGKAITSEHSTGVEKVTLNYSPGSTTIIDALGTTRTQSFIPVVNVTKSINLTQPCGSCGGSSAATTYDANGNIASRTDFNGVVTTYSYDLTRNLETSRTEASGTPQARTITTVWDTNYRLPDSITEPGRVTSYVYDSHGNVTQQTVQDTATGAPRTTNTSYTYSSSVPGAVLSQIIDGPRTDVSDQTSIAYYDPAAACSGAAAGCRGQIQSVTNALGQITSLPSYDANGRPLSITDPNGLTTTLSYSPRGWLTSKSVGSQTTAYTYDNVGQLTQISTPDGQLITYTYDPAHRLTDIQDGLGNRIHYTLDAMGNRTRQDTYDASGTLSATHSRSFDALNRLYQDIGALNQTTTYSYDANGNLKAATDPLNHSTSYQYDALNRLTQSTDANLGKTTYSYNPLDQLTQVSDPKALATTYTVNAFGEHLSEHSPDTGTTTTTYDPAGNLTAKTDAKSQTTTYQYDALNRLTTITYQDGTQAHYTYDQGPNGIGRLTQLQDSSGTTTYQYDPYGHVIQKTQGTDTLQYSYDPNTGHLTQITYPNSQVVSYTYTQGHISSINVNATPLLTNIQYQPFGAVKSWTFGNGQTYNRSFDTDNRLASYPLGATVKTLSYDPASRLTGISDPVTPQTLGYDALNRLTSYATANANQGYQYDANGNRTQLTLGSSPYAYTLNPANNQLQATTGPSAQTYQYDAAGNLTNDSLHSLSYDARGRLVQANTTTYSLNALGQRTAKTSGGTSTRYLYDEAGRLLYEAGATGSKDYIYLGELPVAVVQ